MNGSASYSYSNTGSLTGTGVATFTYDAWDRLVGITTTTGTDIYEYDALGRRVSTYNTGGATPLPVNHLYYSDAWQVLLEQTVTEDIGPGGGDNSTIGDSGLADVGEEGLFPTVDPGEGGNTMSVSGGGGKVDGGTKTDGVLDKSDADSGDIGMTLHAFTPSGYTIANRYAYVWSPVYVDAMVMRLKDATANGSYEERKYVQHDASFNVTAVTDASGSVQERYVYDPYGKPTILTGTWGSRSGSLYNWKYMFQGLRYDATMGLSDMRERVYAPALGRALQADPAGYLDGTNRYQALESSPANYVDPSGLASGPGGPGEEHRVGGTLEWNPERDGNGEGRVETWPAYPNPDGTWGGNGTVTTLPETRNPDGTSTGGDGVVTLFAASEVTGVSLADTIRERLGRFEGRRNKAYRDSKGIWTIGIGHNLEAPGEAERFKRLTGIDINDVLNGRELDDAAINKLFEADLERALSDVRRVFPGFDRLPDSVKMVLVDLIFNMGAAGVSKFRQFRESVSKGDWFQAAWDLGHKNRTPDSPPSGYVTDTKNRAQENISILIGQGVSDLIEAILGLK